MSIFDERDESVHARRVGPEIIIRLGGRGKAAEILIYSKVGKLWNTGWFTRRPSSEPYLLLLQSLPM